MKTGIVLALVASLWAGSAVAECASSPVVTNVSANFRQDQKLYSYYTGAGWSHSVDTMPSWMRVRRDSRWGYDALDLWGVPRSGTYTVSIRYTRAGETVVCNSRLRFQ
jgi:hypothetical protein